MKLVFNFETVNYLKIKNQKEKDFFKKSNHKNFFIQREREMGRDISI